MTNLEAVIAEVQIPGYSDNALTKALIDVGIEAAEDYNPANSKLISQAAINVLSSMSGVKSETEGGYSKTYSIDERIAFLNLQVAPPKVPSIRARNIW